MINQYAKLYRTAIRFAVLLAVVGGFSLAHAINKSQMGNYRYQTNGNSISIGPNQSGMSGASAAVGDLRGSVGTPVGNSGWYVGGNAPAGSATGQTMQLGHFGDVYFSGSKYPFQAAYQVPKTAVLAGLGTICGNPIVCLGLQLAAPSVIDWLTGGGVGINTNAADYPEKPFIIDKKGKGCPLPTDYSRDTGCGDNKGSGPFWEMDTSSQQCKLYNYCGSSGKVGPIAQTAVIDTADGKLPASMDDIAPYMTPRDVPSNVVRDLIDQGADIKLPSAPTVTGPSSITGPTTTTQNPDGSTTTTRTVSNFSTAGNTITNTSNTTINQTCSGTGNCSPSTSTTVENPKPDNPSECEKNPDALMCQKPDLDTPSGDIPRATKSVAYQAESLFGGGSCPANKVLTLHTGQQLTVWDWETSCSWITRGMRPIVLILCGFAAFVIVAGGTKS